MKQIIYIFGNARLRDNYLRGEVVPEVKIGQTEYKDGTTETEYEAAKNRIAQEPRTGLPYPVAIYDWFLYPLNEKFNGKIDNKLRDQIDTKISPEVSKSSDYRYSDPNIINGGTEWVYNINKYHVENAVLRLKSIFDAEPSSRMNTTNLNPLDFTKANRFGEDELWKEIFAASPDLDGYSVPKRTEENNKNFKNVKEFGSKTINGTKLYFQIRPLITEERIKVAVMFKNSEKLHDNVSFIKNYIHTHPDCKLNDFETNKATSRVYIYHDVPMIGSKENIAKKVNTIVQEMKDVFTNYEKYSN